MEYRFYKGHIIMYFPKKIGPSLLSVTKLLDRPFKDRREFTMHATVAYECSDREEYLSFDPANHDKMQLIGAGFSIDSEVFQKLWEDMINYFI